MEKVGEREIIQQKIDSLNLNNNVFLMGNTNDMYQKYQESSIYVMTSHHEGFPMVLIEAHSYKLPIISFDISCGPNEIVINDKNGYLIEDDNIDEMADKINYLIEHPNVREEMSNNTYLDKDKLKIENIVKQWRDIID